MLFWGHKSSRLHPTIPALHHLLQLLLLETASFNRRNTLSFPKVCSQQLNNDQKVMTYLLHFICLSTIHVIGFSDELRPGIRPIVQTQFDSVHGSDDEEEQEAETDDTQDGWSAPFPDIPVTLPAFTQQPGVTGPSINSSPEPFSFYESLVDEFIWDVFTINTNIYATLNRE